LGAKKQTGTDKFVIKQINSGIPYIGESAGSAILPPNIEYLKDMDDFESVANLDSFGSLNLIDFYPLPHYKNFPFQELCWTTLGRLTFTHSVTCKQYWSVKTKFRKRIIFMTVPT
jgi:peptidase E